MLLAKLAISNFRLHKIRFALTAAAVALSVSLVVAVTSGYASAEGAAKFFLDRYIGSTDAMISREGATPLAESIAQEIRGDASVEKVTVRLENESGLLTAAGEVVQTSRAAMVGIRRPEDTRVDQLAMESGKWFDGDSGDEAVIDQVAAEALGAKVGGEFQLPGPDKPLRLKIVGIVHKPAILAAHMQTIYVPLKTLQQFTQPNQPPQVTRVMIELKKNQDAPAFLERWRGKLLERDPLLRVRLTRESRKQFDDNLQGVHLLSYLGGTVSMLAAAFIVMSALSMGVTERQRTLAMMRAIGMVKSQVAWLVIIEGLVLAVIGVIVGVPLGILWVKILTVIPTFKDWLLLGVVVSWGGVALGVGGSLAAALAASLLPAWSAARVSPLEAMSPLANPPASRVPWKLALIGLVMICIDSTLMYGPLDRVLPVSVERPVRFWGHFFLGLPSLMIGFFLLAPMFVFVVERIAGAIIAAMFGLRYALLRQQLSGGVWRAAGTCAALMVGLAILVVMNVQGNSALSGWKLPNRFPDVFITAPVLSPMDHAAFRKLEKTPGIREGQAMPIAIASPSFSNQMFAMIGAAFMPNATMFFGVDPDKVFEMMELDFREGSPEQAREMLKKGRHIVITEEFRQLKGLHVGDTMTLKTPLHGDVDYTVAGVVWSPGIDVIVSMQDMGRQFDERTAASLFGTLDDARKDFGIEKIFVVAANLDYFQNKKAVLARLQNRLGILGMNVGDVREIKHAIQTAFSKLLLLVSTVALSALAVASLGVTNTIMASIRSRRWQFGVLRSIGVTRSQLLRLVLAEATLLGLVGCALGLAAGSLMSVNAHGLSRIVVGYVPPLAIPWGIIAIGTVSVMVISLAASVWPAMSVARSEPLTLLQAGRASA